MKKNRIFRLSILGILFLGSLVAQWLTEEEGGKHFWNAVFENWQSEFLQLGCAVALLWAAEVIFGEKDKGGDE